MATKITQSTYQNVLSGSTEKRVDSTPNGTLWFAAPEHPNVKMYSSTDGGATWKYAPNSDIADVGTSSGESPGFFIDVDGFAHVSWIKGNSNQLHYARGVPLAGGGWEWTKSAAIINPPSINDYRSEIIAFPHGTGWVAFIAYAAAYGSIGIARITLSYNGAVTDFNRGYLYGVGGWSSLYASLDFNHIGDGKTPRADPHIYVTEANNASAAVELIKHPYANGGWTSGTPLATPITTTIRPGGLTSVWDGDRFYSFFLVSASDRTDVRGYWTDFTGTSLNSINPPPLPSGEIQEYGTGIAVAHDIVTDDLYLAVQGGWATSSNYPSDVYLSKLDRAAGTWSAWAKAVDIPQVQVSSGHQRGKIQMQRHPDSNLVHLIYGTYVAETSYSGTWTISHEAVAEMPRVPAAPSLSTPANGAKADLEAGAHFSWLYNRSGPSDSQRAYVFRRNTDGVHDYWNALSQAWQATEVWNASTSSSASMPPEAWINGRSYNWTVRARSAYGFDSAYAPERTVVASTQPKVDITAPIGSVLTESTPLIEFEYTASDPMSSFEARVFKSSATINVDIDEPVWASGVVPTRTARSIRIGESLEDGLSYTTYLQATSQTGLTSEWDVQPFSMAVSPPTGPLVEVSEATSYPEGVPEVRLNLITRSNCATRDQAVGVEGWEVDSSAPATVASGKVWSPSAAWAPTESWSDSTGGGADAALTFQLTSEDGSEPGMVLTAQTAGNVSIRNVLGDPPAVPPGEPIPNGPYDFPALGGMVYTGLAHVRAATAPRAAVSKIRWFDNDQAGAERVNLAAYGSLFADDDVDGIANGWSAYSLGDIGTVTYSLADGVQTVSASAMGEYSLDRAGVRAADIGIESSAVYTISADVVATALPAGRDLRIYIDFISADNTFLGSTSATTTASGRLARTFTAPAGAALARVYVWASGSSDSDANAPGAVVTFGFSKLLLERADSDLGYFDGSFADSARRHYSWTGTPHASTSTELDLLAGLIAETEGPVVFTSTTETRKVAVTAEAPARTLRASLVTEVRDLDAGEQQYVSRLSFHPGDDQAWQPGGAARLQSLRVDRSEDDGKTWKRIRDVVPVDRYQRAVVYDGSFVFGRRQRYRAFTDLQVSTGSVLSSGTSEPASLVVNTDSWVFRDPRTPDVQMLAMVIGHRRSDTAKHSVQQPINAMYPIVDMEGNTAAKGQLTIYVPARQRATMTEILRRGVPILVQSPIGEKWLAQFTARDYESMVGAQRTITVDYVEII